jgi:glyoxylase-like metal-dependent hydrolase (beta-lactamase superfamily II)
MAGWTQQLEIWTSPWGFLKGAAKYGATASKATVHGKDYDVLTWSPPARSPSGAAYKLVGYITPDGLVVRVQTWVEESVFGDMEVDALYSTYRDVGGVKFPVTIVQKKGGQPSFQLNTLGVAVNPKDLAALMTPAAGGPPASAPPPPGAIKSEMLAKDVYRIVGPYNSLAVGFKDYVVIFEPGPQNEARAQAVIAETRRLFPGKPIKYGVISHHHFDHSGGIEAVAAEGIAIVTPEVNKAFLEGALNGSRTLGGDALAKSGKKAVIEAMGDKRVFADKSHSLEIHLIQGLPHADGLVIGYLPKEKILVYADMFNLPTAEQPVTNTIPTQVFLANIERLGLKPERILSIHALVPDRLATMADIRGSLGLPEPAPGK